MLTGPAPEGFTGAEAHQLPGSSLQDVTFYGSVDVQDAEEAVVVYRFDLKDREHCACFHIATMRECPAWPGVTSTASGGREGLSQSALAIVCLNYRKRMEHCTCAPHHDLKKKVLVPWMGGAMWAGE